MPPCHEDADKYSYPFKLNGRCHIDFGRSSNATLPLNEVHNLIVVSSDGNARRELQSPAIFGSKSDRIEGAT